MKKQARLISLVLSAVLIFSIMLSAAFIVTHAEHECTGSGCEICHRIRFCEQLFNRDGLDPAVYAGAALLICFFMLAFPECFSPRSDETPVSMKVKLSC